jgi:hypothetical protein
MKIENCKMSINTSDDAAVVDVYKIVVDELKAASLISPSVDASDYFDPVVKLEVSEINDLGEFFFSLPIITILFYFFKPNYLFVLPYAGTSKSRLYHLRGLVRCLLLILKSFLQSTTGLLT